MDEILTKLKTLGSFAAFAWSHAPAGNYGVVSIDGRTSLWGNDQYSEGIPEGTIDWYTHDPASTIPASIEIALTELGASWYLNSVQYEQDTGFLHYEWVYQYG